jgi:ABC-type phosphate transport system substrate-binding protein
LRNCKVKLGLVAAAALAASFPLIAAPAFADYAPSTSDVVGVGSDTVQYAGDFVADGDFLGDTGYNALGNLNRIINFDATPDANARLAYGSPGVGPGSCPPGLGGTAGTGNQTATHTDQPCTLNPTVVLRAGLNPVQRVNGSGAGGKAGLADTHHYIDYIRASSAQGATLQSGSPSVQWDSIQIGNDPLAMLTATTTDAVPLSSGQLNLIYSCTDTTWTQVGGTSTATIIPILPQIGSGTRSSFLSAIGSPTLGSCVKTAEENDPFAIAAQTSPADAIEPMSGGRLNLFQGKLGTGASNGVGPYFVDPSCAVEVTTPATCVSPTNQLNPAVTLVTTGTPSTGTLFDISRPLYIYFRDSDVGNTTPFGANKPFQPGSTLNFVRTLFYNPCSTGQTGCVTVGGTTFGPGGPPFYDTTAGQALVSAAGISPTYVVTLAGP